MAAIENISILENLSREEIFELGRKAPYIRYVQFPVEISYDFASGIPAEPCDHNCNCDMITLLRKGCQCGGV